MAKANNSGRTKKSHNYKPYDTSNSFVKRITAKVSEILPQSSSWVSRLFSPAPKLNVREREELEEEDEEEEERQPPSKRLCFRSSESTDYSHQNNVNRLSDLDRESGEISPILSSRLDVERDRAIPGPSGLHLRNFVSSTPAVRQSTEFSSKASPSFVKRTPAVEQKKNVNKRSSLNLSSSSTINSTQPSFDTFVFRNPLNKSGLRPRTSLNESCFYPGETTYGGASARVVTMDQPKARVVNVTASPTLQRDTIGTSALRILKALEQFSTPVLDAKKIPVRTERTNLRKRKPPQPYEELIFPSMPELLSLKRREVVNKPTMSESEPQPSPSTSSAVPTSASVSLAPSASKQMMSNPATNVEYSLRPESTKEAHIGSIKGRQKDEELETERVPELNLPNVQLKITSLPKFDLKPSTQVNLGSTNNNSVVVSPSLPKFKFSEPEILEKVSSDKIIPNFHVSAFKFSEPLASIELNKKTPPSQVSQTKFSLPDNLNETNTLKMKITSPNFKLKRKSTESNTKKEPFKNLELKNSSDIKTGSIIEVFNKNNASSEKLKTLKQSENSLQCSKCNKKYDRNKGKCSCDNSLESKHSKDRASETELDNNKGAVVNDNLEAKNKPTNSLEKGNKSANPPLKGFEGYKKPADTWECKECFVRNKNSSDACVSCSTPKNGKSHNPVNALTSAPAPFTFSSSGNKSELTKTATNFVPMVNSIKKPQGQWECNTCLVQNKVDVTSCVACSAPKPGSSAVEKPKPTFSFGIPASSNETSGFQFGANPNTQKNDTASEKPVQFSFGSSSNEEGKSPVFKFGTDQKSDAVSKSNATFPPLINSFKKSSDQWECSTCLVQNKNDVHSCVACNSLKPGSNPVEKPKPTFSFGVTNSNLTSVPIVQTGLNSNSQKIETSAVQPQFTFGNQPDDKKSTTSIFKFGSNESKSNNESKPTFSFVNSDKTKGNEISKPAVSNLFAFGSNAKENKADDTSVDEEKPLKKKVSFGKPMVSEKHISNDTNSSLFGSAISKNNDGSSNFTFPAKSPFENNSTASKEPIKEPAANTFVFGSTEPNAPLKPSLPEPSKPISFSAPPSENIISLTNNEHSNTHNIFGGSFTGFKPPETENKPFSFMANSSQGGQGQFTFNAVTSAPTEPFGSQQPNAGMTMFNQQQQQQASSAPSLFNQQSEPKPFVFGAPPQQQPQSFFAFTAAPQQSTGIGASTTPAFGGFSAPSNSAPVFDPNAKPSFNFTGGATPSFSAAAVPNSTGEVPEMRRVRKAVRRTTQHR